MTATLRQIEANRRNAAHSTGPRTEAGKEKSRRNALKHGMAGSGIVLPIEEAEAIAERVAQWTTDLRPSTAFEGWLVEQAATASIRLTSCRLHEQVLNAYEARRADDRWDEDRAAEAEALVQKIARNPSRVVAELARTKHGRQALLRRWEVLKGIVEAGRAWGEAQRGLALDLLGTPRELRDEGKPNGGEVAGVDFDDPADCRRLAEREIGILGRPSTVQTLDDIDGEEREMASSGLGISFSPMLLRVRRYEAARARELTGALSQLRREARERGGAPAPVKRASPKSEVYAELTSRRLAEWREDLAEGQMLANFSGELESIEPESVVCPKPKTESPPLSSSSSQLPSGNRRQRRAAAARSRRAG